MMASLLSPRNLARLSRVLLLAGFVWLTGRFWHPHYGFTRFLQMDTASLEATVPELRTAPIFPYADGYDGHYYAQLAARPAVNDPGLAASIDNVGYRARRILLSWAAWAVGGGEPVAAVRAYAWLNLAVWAGLAALLWRVFPLDLRGTLGWAGVLFCAGTLHSVRLALTDLLALLLVAAATLLAVRGKRGPAAGLLALGGLARETALLGAVTFLPAWKSPTRDWLKAAAWGLVAALPLGLWLLYLSSVVSPGEAGLRNFTLPGAGWVTKWSELLFQLRTEPDRWLAVTSLLAHVALTVQLAYLAWRPKPNDPWWRLGAVYGALLLLLGTAVWQGHPGAATRVLLPLGLAFNLLAVTSRANLAWLVLGNLSVFSGVLALWHVPPAERELASGRSDAGSYVLRLGAGWHQPEIGRTRTWAWSARAGELQIECWPQQAGTVDLWLAVKGFTARPLAVRQGGRVLWRGEVSGQLQEYRIPGVSITGGRASFEVMSPTEPGREPGEHGRELGFAVYGVRVADPGRP